MVLAARAIDGDTLAVVLCDECAEERVRLLGIDTPERGQPLAHVATEHAAWLLTLGTVVLEQCHEERDQYQRLLRHGFVVAQDGSEYWVSGELLRAGLARVLPLSLRLNPCYVEDLQGLEAAAKEAQSGLWTPAAMSVAPTAALTAPTVAATASTPVPAALPATAGARPTVVVEGSPGFDPYQYIGKGDAYNCADFKRQAEAQAVLRADPRDPNRLDAA